MYVSFACVETTASQEVEKSNIASGVPVMVILCHFEVMDSTQFKFFARKPAIAFIISLQRSPRETVPREKAEWEI